MDDGGEEASGVGAGRGVGTEADLAGDDRGSEVSFGLVVMGGNPAVFGPAIEAASVVTEAVLDFSDSAVSGGGVHGGDDFGLEFFGPGVEFAVGDFFRFRPMALARAAERWP